MHILANQNKRHSPNFDGFCALRIHMFTYFSDESIEIFNNTFKILKKHENCYSTNDLMFGIFNIQSNHYDESNSLASLLYQFDKDNLKVCFGQLPLQ